MKSKYVSYDGELRVQLSQNCRMQYLNHKNCKEENFLKVFTRWGLNYLNDLPRKAN